MWYKSAGLALSLAMLWAAWKPNALGQRAFQTKAAARGSGMQPSNASGLTLTASLRGADRNLISEQGLDVDLKLSNDSSSPIRTLSFNNDFTPTFQLLDSSGRVMGNYSPQQAAERTLGDIGTVARGAPDTRELPPGRALSTWINVWGYREPLGPGKYMFQAAHWIEPRGAQVLSNRLEFEILPAKVQALALGYDGPARANTVMAWLAAPEGNGKPRLLIRQSGFASHGSVQIGGTSHGEFAAGSRLAVSALAMDAEFPPLGWAAVVSGNTAQLIQHNMGTPHWRSAPIPLPVENATPIARFPDRGHAVFLATGNTAQGPALTGLVVQPQSETPHRPWVVKLSHPVIHSACAFTMQGAIVVVFSSDDGTTARLHRIDVNEDGTVAAAERELRQTDAEILGITADIRPGQPAAFIALEAGRHNHDQVAWVRTMVNGRTESTKPQALEGWPLAAEAPHNPERPVEIALETGANGAPWLAMTDAEGDLIGGPGARGLRVLRFGKEQRCTGPQIGILAEGVTVSCFNADGTLFHAAADGN